MSDFQLTELEATLTSHMSQKLYDEKDAQGRPRLHESLTPGQEYKIQAVYNLGRAEDQSPEDWFAEVCDRFTFEVVRSMFEGHVRFTLHSRMRSLLAQGKTEDEIQAALYDEDSDTYAYKPGMAAPRAKSGEKFAKSFAELTTEQKKLAVDQMSDEERAELLEMLG